MTENYQAKRERMQRAQNNLPEGLHSRISLRNAEAVAALPLEAQSALMNALDQGLVKVGRAIELLNQNPQADLGELLPATERKGASAISANPSPEHSQPVSGVSVPTSACIPALTALIRACYPDMPSVAAEALASAPATEGLRAVLQAHESLFASPQFRSDFIVVTFFAFLHQTQERLDKVIHQSTAIQDALRQSGVNWQE